MDERIRVGAVTQPEHSRKMADVAIDGERLGATRIRMRTPYAAETRYEKKFEEAMVLANTLAMRDLHVGATLRSWESSGMPDFTGIIAGRDLAVEIANVTEGAHRDSVLAMLSNRLESMPVAPNRFISITFPTVPLPPKLNMENALREIRLLAADPTLRSFEHVPVAASVARQADCNV